MAAEAIRVRGLRKSYGDLEAVGGIELSVPGGQVFALLGPNGAGKTTTVEILEGFRSRSGGDVSVLGYDPARGGEALKSRIGIVLQSTGIDPFLTVRETIEMYGGYYPSQRTSDEVIEVVGLTEKRDTRVRQLSGGQQRRLDVAVALAGDPELLFLDEPTTGFDPAARRGAWEVLKNLAALGKTILLTTHYMDEAQHLADRVAIIAAGQIVAEGTPDTLAGRDVAKTRVRFHLPDGVSPPADVLAGQTMPGGFTEFATEDPIRMLHRLFGWAIDNGVELDGLEVTRPSLEDVYLQLTGGQSGGEPAAPQPVGRGGRRQP